jgi:hypothetical protein
MNDFDGTKMLNCEVTFPFKGGFCDKFLGFNF